MGATSAMYTGPWRDLPDSVYCNWPKYKGETTLKEIAKSVIQEYGIKSADSIGGSSLGGMVALEIAVILESPRLILIGSALSKAEINSLLLKLAPISTITPIKLTQILAGKLSGELGHMFQESDPEFIRAMCLAISKWETPELRATEIIRVHGENDFVIKCPENCEKVEGAGHLVAITHPNESVSAIKSIFKIKYSKIKPC